MQHNYDMERRVEAVIEEIVKQCKGYNTARALNGIPEKDRASLKEQFTHLQDETFFEARKVLYRKLIKETFMRNGQWMHPVPEGQKKQRLSMAGAFASGKTTLYKQLSNHSVTAPSDVQQLFDQVDQHAVHIDFDSIRNALPEYRKAVSEKYPHASSIVRGEVSAISLALLKLAQEYGCNIIENSGSFCTPVSDKALKQMRYHHSYDLHFIGVSADPRTILEWSHQRGEETGRHIPDMQVAETIQSFAEEDAFPTLMRKSKESFHVWNGGKQQFSTISYAKDGKVEIKSHARKLEAERQKDFSLEKTGRSI